MRGAGWNMEWQSGPMPATTHVWPCPPGAKLAGRGRCPAGLGRVGMSWSRPLTQQAIASTRHVIEGRLEPPACAMGAAAQVARRPLFMLRASGCLNRPFA